MRLVASELLKIRTAPRTVLGLLLAELAIVAIGTASAVDSSDESGVAVPQPDLENDLIHSLGITSILFAVVLGVLVVTWEYRHGTISQTFLVTPVRERVVALKALVAGLAGAALVLPGLVLMLAIAVPWAGDRLDFTSHDVQMIARDFLAAGIVGVLAVELGAIVARQLGALVIAFAWGIFVEPPLAFWLDAQKYLPVHAVVGGILGLAEDDSFPFGRAALTLAVYVVVLGAVAVAVSRRRDIT